jgi:uncharacterized protein YndB with AHSA1/START domain
MTSPDQGVVAHDLYIAARPEIVFSFFTEPEKLVRWLGIRATLDAQPGGVCRIYINDHEMVGGQYLEVTPYSRIVFSWGAEDSPLPLGSTIVEITLQPEAGGTRLSLRHRGIPVEQRAFQATGWDHLLARLVIVVEGGDPGPDPWATRSMG